MREEFRQQEFKQREEFKNCTDATPGDTMFVPAPNNSLQTLLTNGGNPGILLRPSVTAMRVRFSQSLTVPPTR